jgi:hypothetical protein
VDGALGDGVGEVARGGLGVVEDLRKGFAQGRDGALQIHRFGGGDDEGGTDAGSPDRRRGRIWFWNAGDELPVHP